MGEHGESLGRSMEGAWGEHREEHGGSMGKTIEGAWEEEHGGG